MRLAATLLTVGALILPGVGSLRASSLCDAVPQPLLEHLADARAEARSRHGVAPSKPLLLVVIHTESSFRPGVQSKAGALGLMQVMPNHHVSRYGFLEEPADLLDPRLNLMAGTLILTENIVRHDGVKAALRAYHGGSGAVDNPGPATEQYETRVMNRLEEMEQCQS